MLTRIIKGIIMYVVITGTSRGIGLELTRLALEEGHHVLAIARKPDESADLRNLKKSHSHLTVLAQDILEPDAHVQIAKATDNFPCVDVMINNAGVYRGDETIKEFEESFLTNAIKPYFITRELKKKLKASANPVSLQITSRMGSIEDNSSGGSYSYRASKTALNSLFKSFSIDEKWLTSILVHPGWVQTRMGGSGATTSTHDSAAGIWKIIREAKPSQSGSFVNFKGEGLPW
jgi:NAD(P)-dependent dehydrogenase (short-subunit alcohol dehydrogenase family)